MTLVVDWKLANPQEALQLISNDPIGSRNIDNKPVDVALEPNLSFGGDDAAIQVGDGRRAARDRGGGAVAGHRSVRRNHQQVIASPAHGDT